MNRKFSAGIGFGILIGIWSSIIVLRYTDEDTLIMIGLLGAMLSFLGFVFYWGKTDDLKNELGDKSDDGDNSILQKAKIWKK